MKIQWKSIIINNDKNVYILQEFARKWHNSSSTFVSFQFLLSVTNSLIFPSHFHFLVCICVTKDSLSAPITIPMIQIENNIEIDDKKNIFISLNIKLKSARCNCNRKMSKSNWINEIVWVWSYYIVQKSQIENNETKCQKGFSKVISCFDVCLCSWYLICLYATWYFECDISGRWTVVKAIETSRKGINWMKWNESHEYWTSNAIANK